MMRRTTILAASSVFALCTAAFADAAKTETVIGSDAAPVSILEGAPKSCTAKAGNMCFTAGDASTVAVEGAPVAAASNSIANVPRFAPSAGAKTGPNDPIRWVLDAMAQVKGRAWTGNAMFLFFDNADRDAQTNHETVAMFQASIRGERTLPVRLNLSREDGFRPGHSYHMRVAQLINGKEITLSEGDFSLL